MLKKVFEWLRAADLNPDDNMVATRTKAAADLTERLRNSKDYGLLVGSVCAAVGGCERLGEQSSVVSTVLECVRAQQPAFPGALSENALHLRIVCCLGLGELLEHNDEEADRDELMAASLLLAGLGAKDKEAGQHLDTVFDELGSSARAYLQRQAVAARERQDLDWGSFDELKSVVGDPPNFVQKLYPLLRRMIETLDKRSQSDREELEVMWWLYNGYSDRLGKQVRQASPLLAAATIGCEIADRVSPPATSGLSELVAQAATWDRTAAQIRAKTLDKIVSDLGRDGQSLLLPKSDTVKRFVTGSPPILALTWLCMRLEESQGATGWEAELKSKTGLASDRELTPNELAAQVFAERQAQRVYQSLTKG
jgi:hypothetical protein